MKQQRAQEINVLDRVLYLLEENSVAAASENNETFRLFVDGLYERVSHQAQSLRSHQA